MAIGTLIDLTEWKGITDSLLTLRIYKVPSGAEWNILPRYKHQLSIIDEEDNEGDNGKNVLLCCIQLTTTNEE
jgi:hypothetical protein